MILHAMGDKKEEEWGMSRLIDVRLRLKESYFAGIRFLKFLIWEATALDIKLRCDLSIANRIL